ncbi:hypothetical protein PR003_g21401 [Phytophthora rubi]|uniref:Uncharacterized protein n=1 Tax=Phytophthora rubi TaxID=129364 RepID=A0A6A3K4B0_9STRA|nr:hypothetical protein PR002_g18425 [Phytophthora rubi]KAE9003134.1 hypothetical protein PR001_g18061 [Phytophthora rubi]KAE9305800.1 hypothetical protein PR003_g21401 [Phytophthora rubi]
MPRSVGQADIAPEVRLQVSLYLAQRSIRGRLLRGAIAAAMKSFGLCRNSIVKIWAVRTNPRALMAPGRQQPKRGRHLSPEEVAGRVQAVPSVCARPREGSRQPLAFPGRPYSAILLTVFFDVQSRV